MWRLIQRINLALFLFLVITLFWLNRNNNNTIRLRNRQEHHDTLVLNDKVKELELELRNSRVKLVDLFNEMTHVTDISDVSQSIVRTNTSNFILPGPLSYLDHVPTGATLEPMIRIGNLKSGLDLIIGIPTVKRSDDKGEVSYLMRTLNSIITGAGKSKNYGIMIYVGEMDETFIGKIGSEVQANFPKQIKNGMMEIISPPQYYYPDFDTIKTLNSFGDSPIRIKWRQKQNLDYIYLWMSCLTKSKYYIQLEDDVIAKNGFLDFITEKIQAQIDNWFLLEFSNLGFIGKLFQNQSLNIMSEFVLMFWRDKPVDWLLEHIMYTKICNPEKDMHLCQIEKRKIKRSIKPAQFQHVGLYSSLKGKTQKLQDASF